jgi:RNA polymerase sigma-70 factor (ECF subfamily)
MALDAEWRRSSGLKKDRVQSIFNLVESARSGDRVCMEKLVGLFHKEIFRMVYFRTGSYMDAEDLTQEIFMKMSRGLSQLKDPGLFKVWLYRIALNRVRDFHRKKRLLSFLALTRAVEDTEPCGASYSPLERVMEKEFRSQFDHLIRKMSLREREILTLRFVEELGIKEIAQILEKSESTVKTHLYRALKRFKQAHGLRALLKGTLS